MDWKRVLSRMSDTLETLLSFLEMKGEKYGGCLYQRYYPPLKARIKKLNTPQKIFCTLVIVEAIVLLCSVIIPERGKILPVGKQVVEAYRLLKKSPSGRKLIKKVEKTTRGSYVYLTLGDTDNDKLFDYHGEEVLAVTRADFKFYSGMRVPRSVTVIANRDVIGSDPQEVVKSLAFELENVNYSYKKNFHSRFSNDSPLALVTQSKVIEELGL